MNILIVEDSEHDAQIIANALESQGWMTWHVKSLEEAMISLGAVRFDRVTLDYQFSEDDNGLQLWTKLRDAIGGGFDATKAIVITGRDLSASDRQNARAIGINRTFTKPFNSAELITAVRGI